MLCPKCHQPIEGDEVYICCGDTELRWRCESCGKVNEGTAFPFGECPLCGGGLTPLGERRIESAEAREAIHIAFEIGLSGQDFYCKTAREAESPDVCELARRLATMERHHVAILARRYRIGAPEPHDESEETPASLYAAATKAPETTDQLFCTAIKFEERAGEYFARRHDHAPEDSLERQLYKELAAEERSRDEQLRTERDCWDRGKAGLL